MKGIDIFCASQASTAICLSMEEGSSSSLISPSSSSSNTLLLLGGGGGGRAIDRHNPIIRDSRRIAKSLPPCTSASQPPLSPKPANKNQLKKKKKPQNKIPLKENGDPYKKKGTTSITDATDEKPQEDETISKNKTGSIVRKSWSCTRPGNFISPPGSTRYLLGDKVSNNGTVSDFDSTLNIFPEETHTKSKPLKTTDEETDAKPPPSNLSAAPDQVVVLRVSLHCRGCEKKMRKHISRMEGVKSFDIDFLAKKVTVTGKVTPLSVLSSISKVKNAQLWSPVTPSSSVTVSIPSSTNMNGSALMQNEYKRTDA